MRKQSIFAFSNKEKKICSYIILYTLGVQHHIYVYRTHSLLFTKYTSECGKVTTKY